MQEKIDNEMPDRPSSSFLAVVSLGFSVLCFIFVVIAVLVTAGVFPPSGRPGETIFMLEIFIGLMGALAIACALLDLFTDNKRTLFPVCIIASVILWGFIFYQREIVILLLRDRLISFLHWVKTCIH
jgi:hypothetical protein